MEITLVWVLSQIFTVVEYGLLGLSYLAKKRKLIVTLDIFSMICGIVAFILLGADLGMAMSVVVLVANFYYLWEDASSSRITSASSPVRGSSTKSTASLRASNSSRTSSKMTASFRRAMRYVVLVVVLASIAILAFLTYDGPLSLLSVVATTLYEISIWQKSTKMYKFLGIPVAFCWMSYNGVVKSPFGVLCELAMLTASIVGYVREVKTGKKPAKKLVKSAKKPAKS